MKKKSRKIHVGYKPPRPKAPTISELPPGPRRKFRKTSMELALDFEKRLNKLDVEFSASEINAFLVHRKPAALGAATYFVLDWLLDEQRKGVEIIYGE